MERRDFAHARGESGIERVESAKHGGGGDERGGGPGHRPHRRVEGGEARVVVFLGHRAEFEVEPLPGEELHIGWIAIVEPHDDGADRLALGEGAEIVDVHPQFRLQHRAGRGEDTGHGERRGVEFQFHTGSEVGLGHAKPLPRQPPGHDFAGTGKASVEQRHFGMGEQGLRVDAANQAAQASPVRQGEVGHVNNLRRDRAFTERREDAGHAGFGNTGGAL